MTSRVLALGSVNKAHENGCLARELTFGLIVLGAKDDLADILQPNDGAVLLANDKIFELLNRVQVGICRQVHLNERAFCLAHAAR